MFLYEAEYPAGLNLVDGRNAAFGYVVTGLMCRGTGRG